MNLESLRSLQKRIREATGPDREIDLEICKVFGIFKSVMKRLDAQGSLTADNLGAAPFTLDPDGLGPCVALMREVLPGWSLFLTVGVSGDYAVIHEFAPPCRRLPSEPFSFRSYNICLTALDAIFSALIAQEEAKERVG